MEERRLNIFVIIVTYNGMKWIEKCLQSLRASTYPVTTLVIDNCSNDGTRDFIPSHFPEVVWLPQNENLGFGQGNNVGLRYALSHQADHVLLLNQDAYLQPTAIEELLKVADGDSLVSPLHLNGQGERIDTLFRESLKRADNQLLDDLLIHHDVQPSYPVGLVCAACWFMPVSMLKEIGGFNPLFSHYGEDDDYYNRFTYHGRHVLLAPKARVHHDRELHGNTAIFNKKQLYLATLLVACNPNLHTLGRLWGWLKIFVHHPLALIVNLIKLFPKSISIYRARQLEKKKLPCWL